MYPCAPCKIYIYVHFQQLVDDTVLACNSVTTHKSTVLARPHCTSTSTSLAQRIVSKDEQALLVWLVSTYRHVPHSIAGARQAQQLPDKHNPTTEHLSQQTNWALVMGGRHYLWCWLRKTRAPWRPSGSPMLPARALRLSRVPERIQPTQGPGRTHHQAADSKAALVTPPPYTASTTGCILANTTGQRSQLRAATPRADNPTKAGSLTGASNGLTLSWRSFDSKASQLRLPWP